MFRTSRAKVTRFAGLVVAAIGAKVRSSVLERHGPEAIFLGPGRRTQCKPTPEQRRENEDTDGSGPDNLEIPFLQANFFPSS